MLLLHNLFILSTVFGLASTVPAKARLKRGPAIELRQGQPSQATMMNHFSDSSTSAIPQAVNSDRLQGSAHFPSASQPPFSLPSFGNFDDVDLENIDWNLDHFDTWQDISPTRDPQHRSNLALQHTPTETPHGVPDLHTLASSSLDHDTSMIDALASPTAQFRTSASVTTQNEPWRPLTGAERVKRCRQRKMAGMPKPKMGRPSQPIDQLQKLKVQQWNRLNYQIRLAKKASQGSSKSESVSEEVVQLPSPRKAGRPPKKFDPSSPKYWREVYYQAKRAESYKRRKQEGGKSI